MAGPGGVLAPLVGVHLREDHDDISNCAWATRFNHVFYRYYFAVLNLEQLPQELNSRCG
jgi:hypothetical protein